jgi:hypothetical protein
VSEANETATKPFRVGDEGDALKNCDYLCGLVRSAGQENEHAGNSVGILRQTMLETVWLKYGQIPHERKSEYLGAHSQVMMGQAITRTGHKIMDMSPEYGCWSWWPISNKWYNGGHTVEDRPGEQLFVPVQLMYKETVLRKKYIF